MSTAATPSGSTRRSVERASGVNASIAGASFHLASGSNALSTPGCPAAIVASGTSAFPRTKAAATTNTTAILTPWISIV